MERGRYASINNWRQGLRSEWRGETYGQFRDEMIMWVANGLQRGGKPGDTWTWGNQGSEKRSSRDRMIFHSDRSVTVK